MRFISVDKMKQLRESAKNGDERAKKILQMQMNGEDFSSSLDEYFAPVPQEEPIQEKRATDQNPTLQSFLEYNGVKEGDEDYDDMVESFYQEYPNLRPKEDSQENVQENAQSEEKPGLLDDLGAKLKELLSVCDQAIINFADNEDGEISGATLKGTLSTLQEIKQSTLDNFEKVRGLKSSMDKKEEKVEEAQSSDIM